MIKISATQLESYRRMLDGAITPEQFERSLLRLDPPNEMMARGTLFHEMMQAHDPSGFESDFDLECILEARSKMDYRNPIFEYKVRKQFRTKFGDISVTGVADQLLGLDVVEIKTRYSPSSFDAYYNSMQWKVYCELFKSNWVVYKVFEFDSPEARNFKAYSQYVFPRPINNYEEVYNMIHYLHEYIMIRGLHEEPALQMYQLI